MSSTIRVLHINSDRICTIQVSNVGASKSNLYIFGVYLPQRQCHIADFNTHLSKLEELVSTCQNDGEIMIIGDLNCHFGVEHGDRYWGMTTRNAKTFNDMATRRGLYLMDSESKLCSGPMYTFNVEGVGCSYIDHCVVSKSLVPHISSCNIIADCILNTSDHLPISVSVDLESLPRRHICRTNSKISWDKMTVDEIKNIYTTPLDRALHDLITPIEDAHNEEDLDDIVQYIVSAIHTCSQKLKRSKYSKGLKPYWNETLKRVLSKKKIEWEAWCAAGKPRQGEQNESYKQAKRNFRREIRKEKQEYENKEIMEINESHSIDQKYFWVLVNRSKRKRKSISPIQDGRKVITDPTEICRKWEKYFSDLYTPKENYDNDFREEIEEAFDDMWTESYNKETFLMREPISNEEVATCIRKFKNNKAPGWDQVTAEHLKHGGQALYSILAKLFNRMVQIEAYPKQLKIGIIVPIPKGEKDVTIMGNNRGITLLAVISKTFDNVIFARHSKWADKEIPFDPLQGAGKERCSSTHTSYLLREAISYNKERGSTVYVALLDTQKAFDTVWIKGVFVKMYLTNMDPIIWRMLVLSYRDFVCQVRVGNELSNTFTAGQGLHQGAHWSMHMFARHYNDMLEELQDANIGAFIEGVYAGNPTYADDVSIATIHKPTLQRQLDKVHRYSKRWRFDFNPTKCVVIIFGKDTCPGNKLKLGDTVIPEQKGEKHMGILLSHDRDLENEFIRQRVDKARRVFFAAESIGSRMYPSSPVVLTKLYWTNCITSMVHGLEVCTLNRSSMDTLEQGHGEIAKLVQGQGKHVANVIPTATLGWKSLECHIDFLKMTFLWRILLLPMSNIYKKVALFRLCQCIYDHDTEHEGPTSIIVDVFEKYGMIQLLDATLKSGHVMIDLKKMAKDCVISYENGQFKITCLLYRSLSLFTECVGEIAMWPWWVFGHKHPEFLVKVRCLYRILISQSCIKSDTAVYTRSSRLCTLCQQRSPETAHHLLFDCDCFQDVRNKQWQCVYNVLPYAMLQEFNAMNSEVKMVYIASGLQCGYVDEWSDIYKAFINYCYAIYNCRRSLEHIV